MHKHTHIERLSPAAGEMQIRLYDIAVLADEAVDPVQAFVQRTENILKRFIHPVSSPHTHSAAFVFAEEYCMQGAFAVGAGFGFQEHTVFPFGQQVAERLPSAVDQRFRQQGSGCAAAPQNFVYPHLSGSPRDQGSERDNTAKAAAADCFSSGVR